MEYRPLGATGIEVSVLGLGTVKLGRNTGVKYPHPFQLPRRRDARRLIDKSASLGVNLIDTAPAYGTSEERLGELLAGQRHRWVIVTKVGEEFDGAKSTHDFSAAHTTLSLHRSLKRLGTDYLDVVLIHSDGNDARIINEHGTLDCLKQFKEQGLVRAVGISHKSSGGAAAALDSGVDVIMATLNPAHRSEAGIIKEAGRRGCGVLVKKALAGGREAPGALEFAAGHPGVSSVVVGTLNPEHLAENVALLSGAPVSGNHPKLTRGQEPAP